MELAPEEVEDELTQRRLHGVGSDETLVEDDADLGLLGKGAAYKAEQLELDVRVAVGGAI